MPKLSPMNPQLSRAETLPASWYTDPRMLDLEKEHIFARTWQLVGRLDDLVRPGDFVATEIVGEPIVLTRDQGGALHGFYNVCKHRAGPVAVGRGNRKVLQCRYHGWTFGLDGSLLTAREMDGTQNFDKGCFGLTPIRLETWGPFVFANLDPDCAPLKETLGAIPAEVAAGPYPMDGLRMIEHRDYIIDCNWKVYVDNYLEGYHVPIAHPGLYKELDYEQYKVETFGMYSKQYAPMRPVAAGELPGRDRRYMRTEGEEEALYYWVFPNLMLNFYPDNISTNLIVPLGPDKTLTVFEWFFAQPGSGEGWESVQQTIQFSDEIQQEDIGLVEAVQKGLRSRSYDRGRFSAARENGVHHFQMLLAQWLGGAVAKL